MMTVHRLVVCLGTACLVLGSQAPAAAQTPTLRDQIAAVVREADGVVGVAIRDLDTGDALAINADRRFPMQSVYKFPLALAVLHRVDRGDFSLDQVIHIDREQLLPNTWSPIRDTHPGASVDLTLAELLGYVVSQSDNNGCDALFRLVGGTRAVERYIRGLGVGQMAIAATEEEMHRDWQVQFRNWARPEALVDLLERFHRKKVLSEKSRAFLWKLMVETTTGPKRLKGSLPSDVVVGHKTGSSGKDGRGLSAAVNDVGILVLPNGRQIAIAVLITGAKVADEASERVIARIARLAADRGLAASTDRRAPDLFRVRLDTTRGPIVIEVHRAWAPRGADRFYNLVAGRYYDDSRFFRVIQGKWAQFGISGDPRVSVAWRDRTIPDDPRVETNARGTVAFAFAVPNGRTTQVFINLRDNAETHDREPFVPFGRVVEGMEAADALNGEYGESSGSGIRAGRQAPLFDGGNAYLDAHFPRLDAIRRATIEP